MLKSASFKIKGMQRDLSVSAFNPEYAYENKNIRIMPTKENTLLSIINEKGNKLAYIEGIGEELQGIPIGQSVLDDELIIFTAKNSDNSEVPDIIPTIYYASTIIIVIFRYICSNIHNIKCSKSLTISLFHIVKVKS